MQKVILIVVVGLLSWSGNAQDRKNAFKFLPVNLALNSLSFEYERMINPKNSFEFGLGIPMNQTFVNKFSMDWSEEDDMDISNDKLGIFSLRAAFRHYTGKSMNPKGFYYSPYLKYQSISATANNIRTVDDDEEPFSYAEDYDAEMNTIGIGLQLGYQFLIAKRVALDVYFLGLEGGILNAKGTVRSSDLEQVPEIEADIQEAIDDLPSFLRDKVDVSSSGNTVKIKGSNIAYPWARIGISIGIAL